VKALALLLALWASPALAYIQTEWTLYRSGNVPLVGGAPGYWARVGTAASAMTVQVYAHLDLSIQTCRLAYSFNPQSMYSPTGLRVMAYTPLGTFPFAQALRTGLGPVSGGVDVTDALQGLLAMQQGATLYVETVGNGAVGPLVYHAVIECIWHD
jgi:hypothetical protein